MSATFRSPIPAQRRRLLLGTALVIAALPVHAQTDVTLDPVVVTATRAAERSFDLPASVDVVDATAIHEGRPMVNLSESLGRVPGLVARNRQNYAQDLQISSRGFGARSAFGVRGLRLYQDDIPQTMPDGQGQTGSFQLLSASRIEVLRGPFSTLYGNAAGGVIAVFTEDGTPQPEVTLNVGAGSDDTWTLGLKATGTSGGVGYVAAATRFDTDGYRDHSAATRDLAVGKLSFAAGERTRITLVGTSQDQPDAQDPLGLTRAQWDADPRSVDPAALRFDTRKTVRQLQGGMRVEHAFSDAVTLTAVGYAGRRDVRQYLAFSGAAPASSGGVVDLAREFGGASLRLASRHQVLGRPLRIVVGAEADLQDERRRGYVNDEGRLGDLRRDEDDTVRNSDFFAQAELGIHDAVTVTAGVRASRVRFRVDDHFVTPVNPDDSGATRYSATTPVLGVAWHALPSLNLYATWGEGFETPTFAELAYRPDGPGVNFGLQPSTSRAFEVGAKALLADRHRLNVALFDIRSDDEIVVDAATGGRTTFKNAGATRRRGAELAYEGRLGAGLTAQLALTWIDAVFASDVATGRPPVIVPSGNKLPGVPERTAYGELRWTPPALPWLVTALEVQYVDEVFVNDRNTEAAPAYTVANVRVGATTQVGAWMLSAFARVDNLADRTYAGSVIVGDTNGRYYEPAPGRTWFAGATARVRF
ncbi:MAG TPA: TonB-dependent receptor [Casimicrobiaceae bacterium]|nr:TonB-dependent receptor [Casimicrobiaceae bacterium]